jgi:uncharacterized membrane protein YbhN (UPF0104 family)
MPDSSSTAPARWRQAALLVFQIACVAYVARSLYLDRAELSRALDLSVPAFLALAALLIVAHVQRTLEFTYMLRRLGVNEPFLDGFWLTGAGYLLNHLPFNAGLVMRAALLKQDHALPYTSYLSLTMVSALVNVAVGALVGLVAASAGFLGPRPSGWVFLGFGVLTAVPLAMVSLPKALAPSGRSFVARRIRTLLEGVVLIRDKGLGLLLIAVLAGTRLAGAGARLWICFGALGATLSLSEAALLGWGSVLFTLVNVTPGNLGLRELVLSLVAVELGSTHSLGMAATSMDRVVLLAYIVVVGVPGLYSLRRRGLFKGDPKPQTRAPL